AELALGQHRRDRAAGPMTATIRGSRAGTLRTGSIGLDWRQATPLVLSEQTAQLRVLGKKIADVLVVNRTDFTSIPTGSLTRTSSTYTQTIRGIMSCNTAKSRSSRDLHI